jgi:periplasmic divalent cation tolerance protein
MTDAVVVMVTCGDAGEAERIARAALEQRLAACANLLPGLRSWFWWEGRIDRAEEVLLLFKTRRDRLAALEAAIRAEHSYEVFAMVAVPVAGGSAEYLRWIDASVAACPEEMAHGGE